jgi:hypothetical protein
VTDEILRIISESRQQKAINELEAKLDEAVYQLYQLDKSDRDVVENILEIW